MVLESARMIREGDVLRVSGAAIPMIVHGRKRGWSYGEEVEPDEATSSFRQSCAYHPTHPCHPCRRAHK